MNVIEFIIAVNDKKQNFINRQSKTHTKLNGKNKFNVVLTHPNLVLEMEGACDFTLSCICNARSASHTTASSPQGGKDFVYPPIGAEINSY